MGLIKRLRMIQACRVCGMEGHERKGFKVIVLHVSYKKEKREVRVLGKADSGLSVKLHVTCDRLLDTKSQKITFCCPAHVS